MDFADGSDEDIFSPTQNDGLGNIFNGASSATPKKAETKTSKNEDTILINAFLWDGKSYKAAGKMGVTLAQNSVILYKSKTQIMSTTDLSQEKLKIDQHSPNFLGTLDNQVLIFHFFKFLRKFLFFSGKRLVNTI